jgi:hypothetical protein
MSRRADAGYPSFSCTDFPVLPGADCASNEVATRSSKEKIVGRIVLDWEVYHQRGRKTGVNTKDTKGTKDQGNCSTDASPISPRYNYVVESPGSQPFVAFVPFVFALLVAILAYMRLGVIH